MLFRSELLHDIGRRPFSPAENLHDARPEARCPKMEGAAGSDGLELPLFFLGGRGTTCAMGLELILTSEQMSRPSGVQRSCLKEVIL